MMEKISVVVRLIGTFVGVAIGLGIYFVGVIVGIVWSAAKTGYRDGYGKNTTNPPS